MIRAQHKNTARDYKLAQRLRIRSSTPEQILWKELRLLQKKTGYKFRRQHPLAPYVADFVCLQAKLIIELDGFSHDFRQQYDQKRDAHLRDSGYKIIRFSNQELALNKDGVVLSILHFINGAADGNPSPAKTKGLVSLTRV